MYVDQSTLFALLPEIVLAAMAVWIFVGATFSPRRELWASVAAASYVAAALALIRQTPWSVAADQGVAQGTPYALGAAPALSGPLIIDGLGLVTRWLGLATGFLLTLTSFRGANRRLAGEYFGSLMMISAGIMLSGQANDLVLLFVALELVSIPTYVVLFLGGNDRATAEATVKYFFLSLLSSVLLLYGLSFLYGLSGTTGLVGSADWLGIRDALSLSGASPSSGAAERIMAVLAVVLIFAGLGFKLTAVPFHFYAPDVYQGTDNPNAALLAVAPKIVGVVALIRVVVVAMPMVSAFAWQLALVLALLTMTLGNVCALWQTNLRRLMAYSSIAHAGYLLIGLGASLAVEGQGETFGGAAAMLFYVTVYAAATLGTFAALAALGGDGRDVCRLDDIAGLGSSRPGMAAGIALFMFSLAGIPPLAGFWGKLTLFSGALEAARSLASQSDGNARWFLVLAAAGALNSAVAAAYYLKVVATMYFRSPMPRDASRGPAPAPTASVVICAALVVLIGVLPGPLARLTGSAERSLTTAAPAGAASEVPATPLSAIGSPVERGGE